jgi:hypothetical protein
MPGSEERGRKPGVFLFLNKRVRGGGKKENTNGRHTQLAQARLTPWGAASSCAFFRSSYTELLATVESEAVAAPEATKAPPARPDGRVAFEAHESQAQARRRPAHVDPAPALGAVPAHLAAAAAAAAAATTHAHHVFANK